ncbi:MAG: hypothetical protein E7596_00555 [Ruminococcaceae bacterium]|nr:hypothetical protein [Oscillospiraceae bacterium]
MKNRIRLTVKMLAFVMSVLILIASLPVSSIASAIYNGTGDTNDTSTENTSENADIQSEQKPKDVIVLEEDEALREENIKHFKLSDGTTKAVVYTQPVHYKDSNGKWIDIDNALTLNGSEYSTNNKSEIKFANKSGSSGLVSIKDGKYKIDFTPSNTNKVSVVIENPQSNNSRKFEDLSVLNNLVSKAIYTNIYDGIDIEYVLVGNNIKENIIVKEKQDSYTYTFELKLNNLSAELVNGAIILSDYDSDEQVYEIPAPYMLDANNEYSNSVEYSLVQNSKWKYTLTVTANAEWINAEEREFPVTIDPTLVSEEVDTDTFVMSDNGNYWGMGVMIIGNFMGEFLDNPGFVKFNDFNDFIEMDDGDLLVNAKISMFISTVENPNNTDFYIGVYKATDDWVSSEDFSYATSSQFYESTPISSVQIISDGTYEWNITSLYNEWQSGTENHGICVKAVNLPQTVEATARISTIENTSNWYATRMELTYVSSTGIEDYYAYATNSLGTQGTSYVNLQNGSLTYVANLTTISQGLTYDINMVYNSIENKWTPSFHEKITILDFNKANDPDTSAVDDICVWTDADGTAHSFSPYLQKNYWGMYVPYEETPSGVLQAVTNPTVFYPEDEIDYVLEKTTSGDFILKNYDGTQKYFDSSGNLLKICDAQGNVLFLSYEDGNLSCIDYVTVDNIQIPQAEFTYNTDDELLTVHNFVTNLEVSLTWDNNVLSAIEYDDTDNTKDNTININYFENSTKIEKITDDLESKHIQYTFNEDGSVSSVQVYNDNSILQFQHNIAYNSDNTVCTDLGANLSSNADNVREKYIFDEKGRKITLSKSEGNSSTFTIINSWTYNNDILPDEVYYTVSYSSNINKELDVAGNVASIVHYGMNTAQEEFVSISDLNSFSTNTTSNITINADGIVEDFVLNEDSAVMPMDVIGEDNRQPIYNTSQEPYKMVCYIKAYYYNVIIPGEKPQNLVRKGTGFLVGPNLLMTAGHNLYGDITKDEFEDNIDNPSFPDEIIIYPGASLITSNNVVAPYGYTKVESCYIQKEFYESIEIDYDWGICVLEDNIGEKTGWLEMSLTPETIIDDSISIIGYPADLDYRMYRSDGTVVRVYDYTFWYDADTYERNSGSPVFVCDGNYVVQGIHTTGFNDTDEDTTDDFNKATRINTFIYTIAAILNSNS